ncbi:MAG: hypothetical protein ABF293_12240 [Flavobacteriaceae bacterium]
MFTKQNLLATLAGALTMFILGYVIWGVALVDYYEGHTITNIMKEVPDFGILIVSHIIGSFALSTIYSKWAGGNYGAGSGFSFGLWIGVFAGISYSLLWYATSEMMDLTGHLTDAIVNLVFFALVGAVIGIAYKATAPKTASN